MPKIIIAYPPNYNEICKHIPAVSKNLNIAFTYGDTIYNPAANTLDEAFLAHEGVHSERQTDPGAWWERYLTDVQFRLDEEVAAYRVQYQYAVEHYNRSQRRRLLKHIIADLSGEMYGKLVSSFEAGNLITNQDKNNG